MAFDGDLFFEAARLPIEKKPIVEKVVEKINLENRNRGDENSLYIIEKEGLCRVKLTTDDFDPDYIMTMTGRYGQRIYGFVEGWEDAQKSASNGEAL